ncbi:MAG: tripartite tricarboxylate transporter TctB family protein [Sphaerochaetaceae bacterium]|nr:tripartite tricarboxylate transporter TctB family protein [Sphaerochaetaceae bacterium]
MGNILFNAVLILIFLVLGVNSITAQIPSDQSDVRSWPMVIIITILVLLVSKTVLVWKSIPAAEKKFDFSIFKQRNVQMLLLMFGWIILFAAVLPIVGYLISTLIFCIGVTWILGARNWWKMVLTSVVITLVLFSIFAWSLGIHPPRGIGMFEVFSKWAEYLF